MPPKDLPSYVAWVIEQKPELKDTPDDVKTELQAQLAERIENLINAALLAEMPAAEVERFDRILSHGTSQDIQNYVQQAVPNSEEVVARVLLQFRNEYLGA